MTVTVLHGDCREVLRTLEPESVHCVVTSPPYFGLRDYGTAQWEGGDPECVHVGSVSRTQPPGTAKQASNHGASHVRSGDCSCGARRIDRQIGLEPTPDEYIAELVAVFAEVRRVLRADGTVWLNIGDSYNNRTKVRTSSHQPALNNFTDDNWAERAARGGVRMSHGMGVKEKDLLMIPARVAIALQADGWWLRSDIIWAKPNPMPESVTDRPTSAHEHVFLLAKAERYFFDADAVREAWADERNGAAGGTAQHYLSDRPDGVTRRPIAEPQTSGRNIRNVWTIATSPYPEAHFATFPPEMAERCIKAGTSEKGGCYECGAPWVRKTVAGEADGRRDNGATDGYVDLGMSAGRAGSRSRETVGWEPSCRCRIPGLIDCTPWTPKPCTVLDPFGGAGTVGLVADRLQRNAILIELNGDYVAMAQNRIHNDAPLFA